MPRNIAMRSKLVILLLAGLGLAGCGDMNQTQQRTATGALGGGAVGGILGSFSGNTGLGALLGAGVGGGGGYLYDQSQRSQQPRYAQRSRGDDGYRRY
jgi:hypothetical protein